MTMKHSVLTMVSKMVSVFPFGSSSPYLRIVGSINGLLFLSDDLSGYKDLLALWNPLIRKKITLPLPRAIFRNVGPHHFVLGFGYDSRRNDFKVVRLAYDRGEDGKDLLPPIVEVFSLSTGNWREINEKPTQNIVSGYGLTKNAFLNGKVHWIAYGKSAGKDRNLIQVFDISFEAFEEMPLPDALVSEHPMDIGIAVHRKSLAVVFYDDDDLYPFDMHCCIWVMEEYGVGKSWTKMFNVHLEGVLLWRLLGFRKDGDILLTIGDGKVVSYDPRTRSTRELGVFCAIGHAGVDLFTDTYTESLILVNGGEPMLVGLLSGSPNKSRSDSLDENKLPN